MIPIFKMMFKLKFKTHLNYINSSLAAFEIFDNRIPLIYKMEYISREVNHKFRKADSIINLRDIVTSFNLFHILNIYVNHIKMIINNNVVGLIILGNKISINTGNDLVEIRVNIVTKYYPKVNYYQQLNQICVTLVRMYMRENCMYQPIEIP